MGRLHRGHTRWGVHPANLTGETKAQQGTAIDIRIIPFGATGGIHSGTTFYLLDFTSTILPTMGWYESPGPSGLEVRAQHLEPLHRLLPLRHRQPVQVRALTYALAHRASIGGCADQHAANNRMLLCPRQSLRSAGRNVSLNLS